VYYSKVFNGFYNGLVCDLGMGEGLSLEKGVRDDDALG
jgi:hypothetical protein